MNATRRTRVTAAAILVFALGCVAAARRESPAKEDRTMSSTAPASSATRPPIDLEKHAKLATATFALG